MKRDAKIYVAGHRGLVGSALMRTLKSNNFTNIITQSHANLDLCDQTATREFFEKEQPDYVYLIAARVGGIMANKTYPADFLRENLLIQTNIIDAAYRNGTKKLLFVGSSCIYPKDSPQPITENCLMTGLLEPTNSSYSIAKIAGLMMCQSYRSQFGFNAICIMPSNIFGPGDNFDLKTSHVVPALIRKCHEAKQNNSVLEIWGSGEAQREFLFSDDLANCMLFLMDKYNGAEIINVGSGRDVSIKKLVSMIQQVVGFEGTVAFDQTKPEGMHRRVLDVTKLKQLGWNTDRTLEEGIFHTYKWFMEDGK